MTFRRLPSPLVGMLFSAAAYLFFTAFDTMSKHLAREYSIFQVMAVEFAAATVLLALFGILRRLRAPFRPVLTMNRPKLHLIRGTMQIAGQSLTFLSIQHLSLSEFYIIVFCMPILTVSSAGLFLKERAGPYTGLILALNFIGVLIALRPDHGMNPWALVAFAGVLVLAGALTVLRAMMTTETAEMTSLSAAIALALGSLAATPFVYKPVDVAALAMMVAGGALFAAAQVFLTTAFRLAPAALASPPQFLQLVYGAAAGFLVFGDVPTLWIYLGGIIVVGANLLLLVLQRARQPERLVPSLGPPSPERIRSIHL